MRILLRCNNDLQPGRETGALVDGALGVKLGRHVGTTDQVRFQARGRRP
jgi:hypothetical protein